MLSRWSPYSFDGFRDKLSFGLKVFVKTAMRQTDSGHNICKSSFSDAMLAELVSCSVDNALSRLRRFLLDFRIFRFSY